jgi:hypothetical protein
MLLDEELPDCLALDSLGVPGQDLLAEWLDEGLLLHRSLRRRDRQPLGQRRWLGQRSRQQAARGGPPPIVRHRVAADAEVACDLTRPLAQLHRRRISRISVTGFFRPAMRPPPRRIWRLGGSRRRSGCQHQGVRSPPAGWLSMGDPAWLRMGDPGWLRLPDPVAHYRATADTDRVDMPTGAGADGQGPRAGAPRSAGPAAGARDRSGSPVRGAGDRPRSRSPARACGRQSCPPSPSSATGSTPGGAGALCACAPGGLCGGRLCRRGHAPRPAAPCRSTRRS